MDSGIVVSDSAQASGFRTSMIVKSSPDSILFFNSSTVIRREGLMAQLLKLGMIDAEFTARGVPFSNALRGYMGIGSGSGINGGISGSGSGPIGGITSGSDPGWDSGSGLAGGSGRGMGRWPDRSLARKRCNVELHLVSNNEPPLKSVESAWHRASSLFPISPIRG